MTEQSSRAIGEPPPPETMICANCHQPVLLKNIAAKWRDKGFPPNAQCKTCTYGARKKPALDAMSFRDYYEQQ